MLIFTNQDRFRPDDLLIASPVLNDGSRSSPQVKWKLGGKNHQVNDQKLRFI